MPIPDFQSIMRPRLELTADDQEHALQDVIAWLAAKFGLSDEERTEILPSGFQGKFYESSCMVAERTRRVVDAVVRDARFRRQVMSAYDFKCAVTGLTVGSLPEGRATRLLDAAHIRPVGDQGTDLVTNGLSMTPTVHRLFDEGLVTVRWNQGELRLLRSPVLEPEMIESPEQGTTIQLDTGMRLLLPTDQSQWPSKDQVRYHQRQIFKGPESLVS